MKSDACVVILCGGSGTRLWPTSRPSRPKQFTQLVGSESLFLHTAHRALTNHPDRKLLVVAGRAHETTITEQLDGAGIKGSILIEPEARDSGPAIAAAAAHLAAISPKTVMIVLASDHYIPDTGAFQASLAVAEKAARDGYIVTLGIIPRSPSTAYGYIRPDGSPAVGAYAPIKEFREKPDQLTAEQFVKDGYLWNSGNFVAEAGTLFAAFEKFEPQLAAASRRAVAEGAQAGRSILLGPSFHETTKISIDFAVMERTDNACVVPVDWQWSDLGAWDAVHAISPLDAQGNARMGETVLLDTQNSLIRAMPGMLVATSGIRDLAVIADRDAVLVCRLDASQSVKQVVDELKRAGSPCVDLPRPKPPQSLEAEITDLRHWLFNTTLPLWWCLGADHLRGGFHEMLAHDGQPGGVIRRCRVQARQAFVYARAGAMGWNGPWKSAVLHGLSALDTFYLKPDGLYRTMVNNDGSVLDDTAKLYDQAFVLLALAASNAILADAEQKALRLLDTIEAMLRHDHGGFRENEAEQFQSNPHMHLFEACLAWIEAGGGPRWTALACEIANLARTRFMASDTGALREFFDANWNVAPGAVGQRIEPGHQFEWSWLMERWSRIARDTLAADAALTLFDIGVKGIDPQRQVAINAMDADFMAIDASARLWPQTEWLKAASILSTRPDGAQRVSRADFHTTAACLRAYLTTPLAGLWRDKQLIHGGFVEEPAPASSLYHILVAIEVFQEIDQEIGRTL